MNIKRAERFLLTEFQYNPVIALIVLQNTVGSDEVKTVTADTAGGLHPINKTGS
jgi:hypothetical protein